MAKAKPAPNKAGAPNRPSPQTKRQAGKQEKHIHKENMERLKNQRTKTRTVEEQKTARTTARALAVSDAIRNGFTSARDVSGKAIEMQQLISGNRFSNNDATNDDRVSSGTGNGGGQSVTQNPSAGGDTYLT